MKSVSILPSWVESDPLRGRAVDALRLQATADLIADILLPGLSVLTTRARYFSLLAWARRACGGQADERRIHRLEVALAVREAQVHAKAPADTGRCRYVGSRNLSGRNLAAPPKDPKEAFRSPVWRDYRASMRSLELLDDGHALADDGVKLAKTFAARCGRLDTSGRSMLPASACLSKIGAAECRLIANRLGIWTKGRMATDDLSPRARRGALERELRNRLGDSWSLRSVLTAYERLRDRNPSYTRTALREAAVWERLSVGLHAVFLLWLSPQHSAGRVKGMLAAARRKRPASSLPFGSIPIDENAAVVAIQSVRRALAQRAKLEPRGQLPRCDASAFELGELLVGGGKLDDVFARLAERHVAAKGDDAWIQSVGGKPELARDADDKWKLPNAATLHGYRLNAFASIRDDLWHGWSR